MMRGTKEEKVIYENKKKQQQHETQNKNKQHDVSTCASSEQSFKRFPFHSLTHTQTNERHKERECVNVCGELERESDFPFRDIQTSDGEFNPLLENM